MFNPNWRKFSFWFTFLFFFANELKPPTRFGSHCEFKWLGTRPLRWSWTRYFLNCFCVQQRQYPINGKTKPYILMGTIIYRHSQSIVLQNPPFWISMILWIYKPHVMILTFDIHRWHIFFSKQFPPKQKKNMFFVVARNSECNIKWYLYIYIHLYTTTTYIMLIHTYKSKKVNHRFLLLALPSVFVLPFLLVGWNPGEAVAGTPKSR